MIDFEIFSKVIMPAFYDTVYMVFWSSVFSVILGTILGIIIYVTDKGSIMEQMSINKILNIIVNIGRSIPFVILIVALIPLTKLIIGTSIGRESAVVPLTIAAIPFVARVIDNAIKELDKGVIEAAISFGATNREIIFKVLLPESASAIVNAITLTVINIIGYSAMAGTVGAGGLGDVAIRYGYQRYQFDILIYTIIIIVLMVLIVQSVGNILADVLNKKDFSSKKFIFKSRR
ncbi:MAG: methionine ABC transporter permease [Lachnospirales bacterium]